MRSTIWFCAELELAKALRERLRERRVLRRKAPGHPPTRRHPYAAANKDQFTAAARMSAKLDVVSRISNEVAKLRTCSSGIDRASRFALLSAERSGCRMTILARLRHKIHSARFSLPFPSSCARIGE